MKCIKFLAINMLLCGTLLFSEEREVSGCMNVQKRSENGDCPVDLIKNCRTETTTSQASPPAPTRCETATEYKSRVQVGGNYTHAWVTPTGNPTVSGNLGGADALFEYRPMNSLYGGVSFVYFQGNTKGGGGERSLLNFDTQGRVGYTFAEIYDDSRLAFFSGFGGRYLGEKVSVGGPSVHFNYVQFYVPVGVLFETKVASWFLWGVNFQWRPQVFPTVNIVPLDGARWILTKHLNNFLVDVPISFVCSNDFSIVIDPYYELWHDGHSTAEAASGLVLGLPGNKYTFTGVNVNLAWSF